MTNAQQTHPSPEQLAEYARGLLDETRDQEIEVHLSECNTCCETLNCLPEDTFVGILRDQQSPSSNDPTLLLQNGKTASKPSKDDASQIPPGFEDHPRYRIVELIGEGGMGAVYKAEHRKMQRMVALKLINPQLVKQRNGLAEAETQKQDLAGLQYVTRDYMAAAVIHPQRILNKPIAHTAKLYLSQLFKVILASK